jgi:hypothetical protein
MVVLNGTLDAGQTYIAGVMDVSSMLYTPPASAPGAFEAISSNFTKSGTITAAVPEPTSGLLMLVGLAGLALRRGRRA